MTDKCSHIEITECPVCYEPIKSYGFCVTNCDHTFCMDCMMKNIEANQGRSQATGCPLCRDAIIPYIGKEEDSSKNYQVNINAEKWISDTLKSQSTIYTRRTKSHYDASSSDESGFAHDKMYVVQAGLNKLTENSENILKLHYNQYNREYDEG